MKATLDEYKLSCELLGHSLDVRSVAAGRVLPEGQTILSGSRDKTVKVWKPTGNNEYTESLTYQDHKNFVSCVYYYESEHWICTSSNDSTICIYQEDGYVPILTLKGHESTVCSISEGVEPRSLITGSWDKTARIWTIDQMGGVESIVLNGHSAAVWAVATMPAVKKFITGSADKTIFYWNAKGEKLRMLKGHTDCVRAVLTLPDNSLVSCANDAVIRYWNDDGECVREMQGHSNYIYSLALNNALGKEIVLSCGEDSTLRMWNLASGEALGEAIVLPTQSVWSVACLQNGDIVTGSSDGVVRVFTKDPARVAKESELKAFQLAVETRKAQMSEEIGGVKKTDLPGPEALLTDGLRQGQTLMVRHPDGSVKCYSWEVNKWNLVGEVTGASGGTQATSGKTLHEGKEYDFVFSVDISDTEPPIKLPYNRGEDPWQSAQAFIHRHNLPQAYLDQVANFIMKNSGGANNVVVSQTAGSGYQDPFTGGSRYVPGSNNANLNSTGNVDPFTGSSSYSTTASQQPPKVGVNFVKGSEKHFPVNKYITFDNADPVKILDKLREFNGKLTNENAKVTEAMLLSFMTLAESEPNLNTTAIEALQILLHWPSDILFPVLDILRLAVRSEAVYSVLRTLNLLDVILPLVDSSAPNQLMIVRCLANMMGHELGRKQIQAKFDSLVSLVGNIKGGSSNLQIAVATFYLNATTAETLGVARAEVCHLATSGVMEFLTWASDLEACYRAMQAIGNLMTTPFGQETVAQVVSVELVVQRIRDLANTPQSGAFVKLNSAGLELLANF